MLGPGMVGSRPAYLTVLSPGYGQPVAQASQRRGRVKISHTTCGAQYSNAASIRDKHKSLTWRQVYRRRYSIVYPDEYEYIQRLKSRPCKILPPSAAPQLWTSMVHRRHYKYLSHHTINLSLNSVTRLTTRISRREHTRVCNVLCPD